MNNINSIGIFDSGVGGLTVVKEIKKILPNENIIYFGDTARVPYGSKSKQTIIKFSLENTEFLLEHNVKLIVIACNTSSAVAIKKIKEKTQIPIIGVIKPGSIAAAQKTKSGKIGIIGTNTTIKSNAYENEILKSTNQKITVYSQPCPLFVPLVEEGWLDKKVTELIISEYLLSLKNADIDTLVLGCTHYPLLSKKILNFFDNKINLINSAEECAVQIKKLLNSKNLLNSTNKKGDISFFVSDDAEKFSKVGSTFLGYEFNAIKIRK